MLFHLFFFTVSITKRKYSKDEVSKAYAYSKQEARINQMKSKSFEQTRIM